MSPAKILVIDDEPKLRDLLARILSLEGYDLRKAENGKKGLEILENEEFELVITDVRLPDTNGVNLAKTIKEKYPFTEVIVLTAFGKIQDGVEAMRNGVFDYLVKGDNHEQMLVTVPKAIEKSLLQKKVALLEKKIKKGITFQDIIGKDKHFLDAMHIAAKVAETDSNVLILGETGTGKELFAEAIHQASPRQAYPFVALNCAAIPKDLLESELFGHKKGAFTGALYDKKGLFEEADKGTMFLDELAEMHIDLQAKILRVLDSRQFTKVGESKAQKSNVRLIAATNRNLEKQIENENFRADLYYRLSVVNIYIPPLRERKADIELLSNYFVENFSLKFKKSIPQIGSDFMQKLKNYAFPGNVRELRNLIERALILNDKDILDASNLPRELSFTHSIGKSVQNYKDLSLQNLEKIHIRQVLELCEGNKTKTAEKLGIGLTTLYRKMQEYDLG